MVAWVSLDNLDEKNGSALTLDGNNRDQFCGIIYGEKVARQWMSGSSHWRRTENFPNAVNETKTGEMTLLAITYKLDGGQYQITGYRNDKSLGSFKKGDERTWTKGTSEAIWGTRHTVGANNKETRNFIAAHLEEARIYNVALTEQEVQSLEVGGLPVEARDKLATQWGALKSK